MDEAEKLSHRLLLLARGKVVVEGVPKQIVRAKVKKFALEIRQAERSAVPEPPGSVILQKRGATHLYFAESAEQLTPIMNFYKTHDIFLRPSNLEDVFLQISESG